MSLIARILLLIGLTFAAITGAGVYEQISARWKSEAELKDDALRLAYTIGADQDRITEGARQLLLALSMLRSVAERDPARCSHYLIEIKQQLAMYEYLGAADGNGIVFCSSNFASGAEVDVPRDAGGPQEASPALYINSYGIAFTTHRPILRIAYPIMDDRDGNGGHMFAGLSLRWLNEQLAEHRLPDRAALIVADRNGIVIGSHPDADLIGQTMAPSLMAQLHAAKPGTTEVVGSDGLRRVYGFVPVEALPGQGVFVAVGLDAEAAAAELSRSLWRNLTLLAATLLTASMAAWIYVRRFIRAPLEALLETAHRWREGDRAARAVRNPQVAEVDRLATAFNAAADAIEAHERQLREAKQAAELLGDSFRLLFESNPVPLWVFDRETLRFLRVNDATLAQYGYTREQYLSMTIRDVMVPEDWPLLDHNLASDSRDLVKVGVRRHFKADGSRIFVNITRHELMLDGRNTVLVAGIDVTDAVRAETQLRQTANHLHRSREHLAIAQRVSGTGSIERDPRTGEVEWSEETSRIFGVENIPNPSKRGTLLLELIHPDDRDGFAELIAQMDRGVTPPSSEFRIVRPDGQERIIHRDSTILFDEDGTPARMVSSVRDVTEQRAAEARLQEITNNLRHSQEHLAIAQRVSATGSIERNLRTGEAEWSEETNRIFGFGEDPGATRREALLQIVHPEDRDRLAEFLLQVDRGVAPPPFEFRIVRPDGKERIIHRDTTILFDEDGTPARMIASLRDITEQRAAETRLREIANNLRRSQEHLAIAQRVSGTGSIERDLRTNEVEWSDEARRIFGVANELPSSRRETFSAMIHPDDRDRFWKLAALTARGITPPSFDFRIIRPDGQERIIHRDTTILLDEEGTPLRMIGSIKDVTEQRAAEARLQDITNNLRRSREHLAIAQRVSGTGSVERNLRTAEVEWSEQARRIFLGEVDAVGSKTQPFFELIHPDDREKFAELQAQMNRGITPPPFEFRIIRPDGQERIIHRDTTILFDDDGTPARVVGSLRDVTDLRAAEERQRQLERQLQHSQKLEALGTLAGGIAHDLNNTLVPILALAKITLRHTAEGSRGRANLDTIFRASERARDLVQQILAFSRKQELTKREVDLLALTRETLQMLRAGLPATIDIVERIDAVPLILGDPGQLQQVLVNLMTNAAQAIGDHVGTITVALAAVTHAPLDRSGRATASAVRLRITDTGCGMDKATLDRIFEPFFTTKPVGEGTGLGLAVVHGIITSHGGRIAARSQPSEGTEFTILLPLHASAVAEDRLSMTG